MAPLHLKHLLCLSLDAVYITSPSKKCYSSLVKIFAYQVFQYLTGMMTQTSTSGPAICFTPSSTCQTLNSDMRAFPRGNTASCKLFLQSSCSELRRFICEGIQGYSKPPTAHRGQEQSEGKELISPLS